MPAVEFEPKISVGERPQTYTLDRAATGTGKCVCVCVYICIYIYIHIHTHTERREALPTQFHIQESAPPALSEMEVYEHLGVPTGYHVTQSANKALKGINFKLKMIGDFLLAPWQKLDAINTFILPRVSFHLKNGVVQKGPLNLIDRDIKRIGKRCLNLPQKPVPNPCTSAIKGEAYISYQSM